MFLKVFGVLFTMTTMVYAWPLNSGLDLPFLTSNEVNKLNQSIPSLTTPTELRNDKEKAESLEEKYQKILKELATAKPEEQRYDEQNSGPQEEEEDDMKFERNNESELKEQSNNQSRYESDQYNSILKDLATAKPEEQRYDEQNPGAEDIKESNEESEEDDTKPLDQNYNEEVDNDYDQDIVSVIFEQKPNGPSFTEIIEIDPRNDLQKNIKKEKQQVPPIGPVLEKEYTTFTKIVIPEAPTIKTSRLSMSAWPISLSSLQSIRNNWANMFKIPNIIYLH